MDEKRKEKYRRLNFYAGNITMILIIFILAVTGNYLASLLWVAVWIGYNYFFAWYYRQTDSQDM